MKTQSSTNIVDGKDLVTKTQFGVVILDVVMSNPNGCIDSDNAPRDGWISSQCYKHKVRNLISNKEGVTWDYIKSEMDLNDDNFNIFESPHKGFDVTSQKEAIKELKEMIKSDGDQIMSDRYWDNRVFGSLSLEKKPPSKKGSKKDSSSEEPVPISFKRTGVAQFTPLRSILNLNVIEGTLTKANSLSEDKIEDENSAIGSRAIKVVEHAVYFGYYVINPTDAHVIGTTNKDIDLLKFLMPHAFDCSTSACRAGINTLHVYHAETDSPLSSGDRFAFNNMVIPKAIDPDMYSSKSVEDYSFAAIEDLRKAFPNLKITDLKNP